MDPSNPVPAFAIAGPIAAALLIGIFSFVNLVLSKEIKISDARLAWNDSLRADISTMLANVETLARLADHILKGWIAKDPTRSPGFTRDELAEFRKDHKDEYLAMNEALHRIGLRLNPAKHKYLADAIAGLFKAFRTDCANAKEVYAAETLVVQEAQKVLRGTWKKVKDGEATYVRTKWILSLSLLGVALFAALFLVREWLPRPAASQLTPQTGAATPATPAASKK